MPTFKAGDPVRHKSTGAEGQVIEATYLGIRIELEEDGTKLFIPAKNIELDLEPIEQEHKVAEVKYKQPTKATCRFCRLLFTREHIWQGFCSEVCKESFRLSKNIRHPDLSPEQRSDIARRGGIANAERKRQEAASVFGQQVQNALDNEPGRKCPMPTNTDLTKAIIGNLGNATIEGLLEFKNKLLVEMNTAVEARVKAIASEEEDRQKKLKDLFAQVAPAVVPQKRQPHCTPERVLAAIKEVDREINLVELNKQYGFNMTTCRKYVEELAGKGLISVRKSSLGEEDIRGNPAFPVIFVKLA